MATKIDFTDGVGAASLVNNYPAPGNRFSSWTPMPMPVGDSVVCKGTGATVMFVEREDFGASFDLAGIAVKATSGAVNQVAIANRLIAHLLRGGTCSVTCGDSTSAVYATCGIWPGSRPTLQLVDKRVMEYKLSLQLINLAASPVAMDCVYQ